MDAVSGLFLNALGTDMVTMEEYFPFVSKAFDVMQYTAWAILFLITVWQLFRVFGGPITEAEEPWQLVARSALFALLIGFAKPIFTSLTSGVVGIPGTFPDPHARHHTDCSHDSDLAAFGGDFSDGCGRRFVVPVSRSHRPFLGSSAKTAFQEDRIPL